MKRKFFDKLNKDINVTDGLLSLLVGDFLGSGVYRDVYVNALNEKQVLKVAKDGHGVVANAKEFDLWSEVSGFKGEMQWVKDWFCPVVSLSYNGAVLIMERTFEKPTKKLPDEVPSFMFDVHKGNFGWIGNKFVCHDYAAIPFYRDAVKKKMKKAHW